MNVLLGEGREKENIADQYLLKEQEEIKEILCSMDSFQTRLSINYNQFFPTQCEHCRESFDDMTSYYKKIKQDKIRFVFSIKKNGVYKQKFNCRCEQLLFETSFVTRDESVQGEQLRLLFDLCVENLSTLNLPNLKDEDILCIVRSLFSDYINLYAYYRNEIPLDFIGLID